jgi:beta-barrel assembly-enhancing protease
LNTVNKNVILIALACSLALTFSCSKILDATGTVGTWLISDAEETTMGNNFYLGIVKDSVNYKPYKDTTVVNYVKNLGRSLATAQTIRPENTDFHYNFDVINNDTVVNAFAMPGGHMFVYTGLILKAHNEAELAGVMYHELSHVILRHGVKSLANQYAVSALTQLVLGDSSLIGSALDGLLFLKYSKSNESEADSLACLLLNLDHYNPYGMTNFLQVLYNIYGDGALPFDVLSDHPLTSERIAATKRIIGRMSSPDTSAAALYASRLTPIVQYIQTHPH